MPVAIASAPKSTVHLTPGFIWAMGFGEEPRIPLIGDVDGDGFADLLAVYPSTGTVYLLRNERGEKLIQNELSVANLGKNCLAAAIGHFSARAGSPTEIVGVQADGSVRVAYDFRTDRYRTHTIAAKLPKFDSRASLAVGDFNGDGYDDVAIVGTEHQLLLLWNEGKPDAPSFVVQTRWISPSPDQLAAGDFDGDGRAELVWMAGRGEVWRATVSKDGLGAPRKIYRGKAEEALVVGHFSQTKSADLLVGATLLPAADASRATRWEELTRPSGAAIVRVGDLNHKGRDDVIRFRRTKEKFVGDDVIAYTSYAESDPDWDQDGLTNEEEKVLGTDPRNRDTDGDGLLDGWEVHGLRGYDLAALGCSPTHKDVICEIQRRDDVKEELVKKQFQKIVAYYAGLPIENPDGKPGLALHPLFREPIPAAEAKGKGWYPLGERYFAREKRGVAHWMVINPGGGGQSSQLGFMGGSGSEQLYHSFIHEFGHQLGLDHTGYWGPAWCPIYPSLMNYAYSYGFDGKPDAVHYSRGTFAKLVLHEENLDERLPFPIQQLHFLQSGPYHYKMKPDGPNATLIDWNWNGIFGERNVRADINYGYSTYGGERLVIDRTVAAPFLLAHRDWLLMFYVKEAALEIPNPLAPAAPPPFPDHPKSGKLLWRALLDKGKGDKGWSRAET
ncbi:MAG: VCBS repeat-containing protein, partial [Fimbriimonas ginsengisoli]|nr:VCBS repeat-containing protein [Fimbriimonas ginsengisoli]